MLTNKKRRSFSKKVKTTKIEKSRGESKKSRNLQNKKSGKWRVKNQGVNKKFKETNKKSRNFQMKTKFKKL